MYVGFNMRFVTFYLLVDSMQMQKQQNGLVAFDRSTKGKNQQPRNKMVVEVTNQRGWRMAVVATGNNGGRGFWGLFFGSFFLFLSQIQRKGGLGWWWGLSRGYKRGIRWVYGGVMVVCRWQSGGVVCFVTDRHRESIERERSRFERGRRRWRML